MKKSTLFNCKKWEVSNGTCSISKHLAILIVMMVMIGSKALAGARFEVIDGLKYVLDSDTKTATLMANTEAEYSGDIVVPESVKAKDGNDYKIIALGDNCFKECRSLTSIEIPSSVTSLGAYCFRECVSLTSIKIPSPVTSIGKQCFKDCCSLTAIDIPSSVTSLEEDCFNGCSNLISISIPSSVTSLGDNCFQSCQSLTSIEIPSSVTSFGACCFIYCTSLASITIPSSVTSLGAFCFQGCNDLTSLEIPSSVIWVGTNCFSDCKTLESLYFKGRNPGNLSNADILTTCIIYVPTEYLQDYKDALGADYKYIYTWNPNGSGEGDKPVTKCATPTVSYESGELKFACETAGAKYHYTISDKDMATDAYCENGKVALSAAYEISVYATADGHSASEMAQATLYWLNANLKYATNINMAKTRGVVASAHDGIVSVSGLDNGEVVKFYAADGKYIGQAVATNGTASYAVSEALVIAKVGNNSIKIAIK